MKLNGRRESTHVDDRRGMSTGTKVAGGGGILGIIIAIVISLAANRVIDFAFLQMLLGGDLESEVFSEAFEMGAPTQTTQREFTAEEQELAKFSKQILAGTEDVWTELFPKYFGMEYEAPELVLYTGQTQSGCGTGTAQMGPFYCSADQKVYIDLSFFMDMKRSLGADGDFAYAYVIAHEVGHHVQYLTGQLNQAHAAMQNARSKAEANEMNVRLELQADFYAGVWAHHDNAMYGSLEEGDVDEALDCAQKIGDDYLQKKAQGYSMPETFTHGKSEQRSRWLKLGIATGDVRRGDTYTMPYKQL